MAVMCYADNTHNRYLEIFKTTDFSWCNRVLHLHHYQKLQFLTCFTLLVCFVTIIKNTLSFVSSISK